MTNAAMISPWEPDTNPANLRPLGKCIEEVCEAGAILARCIIQGIEESEPVTGKPNRQAVEEEVADVQATSEILIEHFGLDRTRIAVRAMEKKAGLKAWFDMMETGS
jgi:hypothetical protein